MAALQTRNNAVDDATLSLKLEAVGNAGDDISPKSVVREVMAIRTTEAKVGTALPQSANEEDDNNNALPRSTLLRPHMPKPTLQRQTLPLPTVDCTTSTYDANSPSEDRSASIRNIILLEADVDDDGDGDGDGDGDCKDRVQNGYHVNMFVVLDGHGGFIVAQFASANLLPSILEQIARELQTKIYDKGTMTVNDEVVYPLPKAEVDVFGELVSEKKRRRSMRGDVKPKLHPLYADCDEVESTTSTKAYSRSNSNSNSVVSSDAEEVSGILCSWL